MTHADSVDTSEAVSVARKIVQGELSPISGAEQLGWMASEYAELADALMVFKGIASEWEDIRLSADRDAVERDVVVAADRLLARYGP